MKLPTGVLPAIRRMKDFEKGIETSHEWIVFLETRLSQLKSLVEYSRRENKKVLIHFDLIQGLKSDEYGMEFLIREVNPEDRKSTRLNSSHVAISYAVFCLKKK